MADEDLTVAHGQLSVASLIGRELRRPYPITLPMVLLFLLVPFYLVIAGVNRGRPLFVPALPLDAAVPLVPAWALVYGCVYLFLILLPVFVIREEAEVRRTFRAYLFVWITAYAFFLAYPTVAPRPEAVAGEGFAAWGLRALYASDPPYNCFPSLHVAHSFVSALACTRAHRGVGLVALLCACLVALSTLFTRQHYVADVLAGILLAGFGWLLVLARSGPPKTRSPHRAAPALAVVTAAIVGVMLAGYWAVYRFTT